MARRNVVSDRDWSWNSRTHFWRKVLCPLCGSIKESSSECLQLINPEQTERDDHALRSVLRKWISRIVKHQMLAVIGLHYPSFHGRCDHVFHQIPFSRSTTTALEELSEDTMVYTKKNLSRCETWQALHQVHFHWESCCAPEHTSWSHGSMVASSYTSRVMVCFPLLTSPLFAPGNWRLDSVIFLCFRLHL